MRAHGLQGQVVVELWTNREERMSEGVTLECAGRRLRIERSSRSGAAGGHPRWLVAFAGVGTRNQAEALRGEVLRAEPLAVEGALWVHELIGSELYDTSGELVGTVAAVEANPAADLLVLADGRIVPLTFVAPRDGGRLVVEGPDGLLDPAGP